MKLILALFACMLAVATASPSVSASSRLFQSFQLEAVEAQYQQIVSLHSKVLSAVQTVQTKHFHSVARHAAATHAMRTFDVSVTSSVSQACKDAIAAIDTATNSTACAAFARFQPDKADQATYESVCSSSCLTSVTAALTNAGSVCGADIKDPLVKDKFQEMKSMVTGLCIKDNNEYCMPKFFATIGVMEKFSKDEKGKYTVTDAQLDQLCTSCSSKIMAAYTAAAGDATGDAAAATAGMKLLCLKDQGKYCYPQVADMSTTIGIKVNYEAICSPCFRRYALESSQIPSATLNQFGLFCSRDEKGKLCLERYADFGIAAGAMLNDNDCVNGMMSGASANPCDVSACANAMRKVVSDMGCCFGTLFDMQSAQDASYADSSTGAASGTAPSGSSPSVKDELAKTFCLSSVPSGCKGASKAVKLSLTIPNLSWSWYTASAANKKKADDAVRQDLAAAAGVVPSAVTLTSKQATTTAAAKFRFMATSSGVTYDSTIAVDTDAQADFVTNDVKSQASAGTLALSSTSASLPTESKNNAAQSYDVAAVSAETTTAGSTGAAASVSISIFSIVAVFVAIVMIRA